MSNVLERTGASRTGAGAVGLAPFWQRRHLATTVALGLMFGVLRMAADGDGDAFWGARAGIDTLKSGLPRHDTYSWSARGVEWIANSWAWNVVLGIGYRSIHMAAFPVASILLGGALGLVVALYARRIGAQPMPTIVVFAMIGALALGGAPRATSISAFAGPVALMTLPAIIDGERRRVVRGALALGVVQTLWINLHSGGLLGPVLIGTAGLGLTLVADRPDRLRVLTRAVAASAWAAVCCLVNPYGATLFTHAAEVRKASQGVMAEWQPFHVAMLTSPTSFLEAAVVVTALVYAGRRHRYDRLLVLALMTVLSLTAVRFTAPLLVFAIPEAAAALGSVRVRPFVMRTVLGVLVAAMAVAALNSVFRLSYYQNFRASPRLVAEIPAGCKLLNDDVVGGAVILLRPDVPVWFDDRNDMYGRARTIQSIEVYRDDPGTLALLDRLGITCVLDRKTDKLSRALAKTPGWRVLDSDASRLLLVRDVPVAG